MQNSIRAHSKASTASLLKMTVLAFALIFSAGRNGAFAQSADATAHSTAIQAAIELSQTLPDSALILLEKAKRSASAIEDTFGIIQAQKSITQIYNEQSRYNKAVEANFEWLSLSEKYNQEEESVKALNELVSTFGEFGKLEEMKKYALDAHRRADALNQPNLKADIFVSEAIYATQPEESIKLYQQGLAIYESLNDTANMSLVNGFIGRAFARIQQFEISEAYQRKALMLAQKTGNERKTAHGYYAIGEIAFLQGKNKESIEAYLAALALYEKLGKMNDMVNAAWATRNLADLFEKEGLLDKAVDYAARAHHFATKASDLYGISQSALRLSRLYEAKRNLQKALLYQKQYAIMLDSMNQSETNARFKQIESEYETEKKDREIALLKSENELRAAELKNQTLQRNTVAAKTFLLGVVILLVVNRIRLKNRTERKLNEANEKLLQALHRAEKLHWIAEEANHFKTELLGIAAHDLRNPLQSIIGFSKLIDEQPNDVIGVKQKAERIRAAAYRMIRLIEELLEISMLESGKLELRTAKVDVCKLIETSIESFAEQVNKKRLKIQFNQIETCIAEIDSERMMEVFDNLISNAIKYSPKEKNITISARRLAKSNEATTNPPKESDTGSILIAVKDEGQGLTREDKEKLFGKFQRLSARPTGGESSTGLGLSIVKELVELHGGKVWAESEGRDKGTTFLVELPVKNEETNPIKKDTRFQSPLP